MGQERSIAGRVMWTVLLAQLVCATALSLVVLGHERQARLRALDVTLAGRADSLAGAIQDADDEGSHVMVDPQEFLLPAGDAYAVYGADGYVVGRGGDAAGQLLEQRAANGLSHDRSGGVRYRVEQRPAIRVIDRHETGGVGKVRPVTIVYATPETRVLHEVLEGARFYLLTIVAATALTALLVVLLVRTSLRPVEELAAAAGRIRAPEMVFTPPGSVGEVRELAVLSRVLGQVAASVREAFAKEQRFLSDAAHELKTAIAVVQSSVQLMLLRPRSAEAMRAGLEGVLEDTARVEAVIRQMLQLSDVTETGTRGEACSLTRAAAGVERQLHTTAEVADVRVELTWREDLWVGLPVERAEVLVRNLLMNAIQHSGGGGRTVCVEVERRNGQAVLSVRDEGGGIGAEALPLVFERFYREDASRSRRTGGTGLGLPVCKAIVEGAGGTIGIESEVGAGTTVRAALPLV